MNNIIEPTMDYDFSKIYLGPPSSLSGGAYFTRIMVDNNRQLFIQTPKCLTKQGFIKSGKKIYTDLMFDNNDTVFINWIENLETKCQQLMFSKADQWFETKIEKDDIETAFTSPFKIFKSGKFYLLRVNVKPNIKIYDETDNVMNMDDITVEKNVISILEIQGIKFTSRNFQIEIELKQSMVVSPDPFLDECFIKKPSAMIKQTKAIPDQEKNEMDGLYTSHSSTNSFIKESASELLNKDAKPEIEKSVTFQTVNSSKLDKISTAILENTNTNKEDNSEEPISLDIEDLSPPETKEDPNVLKEVDLASNLDNTLETITLKKHNQVYYEIYEKAREKAKAAKQAAINAYLELKQIKKTYMIDDVDESDDSEFDEDSDSDDNNSVSETSSVDNNETHRF
jgi:hypothetical protein